MKRAHSYTAHPPTSTEHTVQAERVASARKVPALTSAQTAFHTGTQKSAAFSVEAAVNLYAKAKPAK